MTRIRLTPAAQRDLSSIWDFTAQRWDELQAERYVRELQAAIERVADDSERAHRCDDIRPGYRRFGSGSHHVYLLERREGIDVIRILHQRMDPSRHV